MIDWTNLVSEGLLSDARLESVIYAGKALSGYFAGSWTVDDTFDVVSAVPDDAENAVRFRRCWFLDDGTGAGKGPPGRRHPACSSECLGQSGPLSIQVRRAAKMVAVKLGP